MKTYFANIHGAYVFYSPRYEDERGDYCNISTHMVVLESGTAQSKKNVLRGMHCSPFPKVIACLSGIMYDVLIDLRKGSPTFQKWESYVLKNDQKYVYVPAGVAHGYFSMEDGTLTLYYKGAVYDPAKEINVNPLDPALGITWPAPVDGAKDYIMSDRDRKLPTLAQVIASRPELNLEHKKVWYAPNKFEAYGEEEIFAVARCLRDGWLAPGPLTAQLEKQVSTYFGKKCGTFVNSGSSANLIALNVLLDGFLNDPASKIASAAEVEVVTPACTFSTVVAPIDQLGMTPVFVDIDLRSYVPTVEACLA